MRETLVEKMASNLQRAFGRGRNPMKMSGIRSVLVPAILLLTGSSACLNAQGKRITVDVVVDAKGSKLPTTVAGLQQQDFTVLDNKAPRTLTSFRAVGVSQQPVRVVVLVDAVNIRLQGLAYERNQLAGFLRAQGGHLAHPTAIAILTDKGLQMEAGFSTDGNAMSEELKKEDIGMRTITRATGFYGAEDRLGISINGLRTLVQHEAAPPGRTVVLWISPGWPLLSGPDIELSREDQKRLFADVVSLSTQLREARVTLYAVDPIGSNEELGRVNDYERFLKGVGKFSQVDAGDLGLQVLAVQSGGLALNSNDTAALLQRCVADLDNYYEISFDAPPAETGDTYHHLEIRVDKPGEIARTRDGYYAEP
jgi:VWFA-related protein